MRRRTRWLAWARASVLKRACTAREKGDLIT
jgi:hypothetical protein